MERFVTRNVKKVMYLKVVVFARRFNFKITICTQIMETFRRIVLLSNLGESVL